jgi:anaerobic ribonucleoside-triphosphate reductase activating protein
MNVAISRLHFPVTTLGPGRRIGIWFQGCTIRCPGCISMDTWAPGEGSTQVEEILAAVLPWAREADGLTISGGEPFEQPEALKNLLQGWRRISSRDVLVFSGFSFEAIEPWLASNDGLIDALISGPYKREAPQTLAMRGSDNQQLHVLSPSGARFEKYNRLATPADRKVDVMFDATGAVWFAGIPASGDFLRFRRSLESAGHHVKLFGDPSKAEP